MHTNGELNTTPLNGKLRCDDITLEKQVLLLARLRMIVAIESSIAQERLRQARYSYNLACLSIGVFGCIGTVLLLTGRPAEGAVFFGGGFASRACYIWLARDSNDRLDRILRKTHH